MLKNKGIFRYEWKKNKILFSSLMIVIILLLLLLYANLGQARIRSLDGFSETFVAFDGRQYGSYTGLLNMDFKLTDYAGKGAVFQGNFFPSIFWTVMLLTMAALVLSVRQFFEEKLPNGEDFLFSLPLKRKEIRRNKLLHGAIVLGIPYLVYSAGVLLIRGINARWIREYNVTGGYYDLVCRNDSWETTVLILLLGFLTVAAVYLTACMFQSMCNNSYSAGILSCTVFWIPMYVGNIVNNLMIRFNGSLFRPYDQNWLGIFQPMKFFLASEEVVYDSVSGDYVSFYTLDSYWQKLGFLFAAAVIAYFIGRHYYLHTEGGNTGMVFRRKWLNTAFHIVLSCLAGLFLGRLSNTGRYGPGMMIGLMVLTAVCVFLLLRRLFRDGGRRKMEK